MELISDILLVAGALGAGLYCFVLAGRLRRFNDLEKGVGGAVAVLSSQVEELKQSLEAARETAQASQVALDGLTGRAEKVAHRLELLMASMHDVTPAGAASEHSGAGGATPGAKEENDSGAADSAPETTAGPIFLRHARREKEKIA